MYRTCIDTGKFAGNTFTAGSKISLPDILSLSVAFIVFLISLGVQCQVDQPKLALALNHINICEKTMKLFNKNTLLAQYATHKHTQSFASTTTTSVPKTQLPENLIASCLCTQAGHRRRPIRLPRVWYRSHERGPDCVGRGCVGSWW